MDRQIIYPGQIPLDTDLLSTNKNAMVAIGKLAGAALGTATISNGLAVTPGSGLAVSVAPGEIYSLQNIDNFAYGSLALDTADQVVKQGILLAAVNLLCPAPATSGQSINYLIQAAFSEADTGAVALPYFNAANPTQAWFGPNNSGTAQPTVRQNLCVVSAVAGTAAATGTQATPSPAAGAIGLAVVTVAFGQTSITSANISQYTGASLVPQNGLASNVAHAIYSKSVAGSADVTLTVQEAAYPLLTLTGTLAGNINLIVPAVSRQRIINNQTNSTFTVKTPSGTGVIVPQGMSILTFCDGTNVMMAYGSGLPGSALNTMTKSGDQFLLSQDVSGLREGSCSVASGDLYTLLGGTASSLSMKYQPHNFPINATGMFGPRDETSDGWLKVTTEGSQERYYYVASGAAGVTPVQGDFTLKASFDYSTGNFVTAGSILTAMQAGWAGYSKPASAYAPTVTVGTTPYGIAYCPSNDRIYVTNYGGGSVSVINPATNTVATTITVASPYGVAYSPTNDRIYVTNYGAGMVSVINPATNTVVATVTVGTSPIGIAYSTTNDRINVANASGSVSVINPTTNTVVATVTIAASTPYGVAYSPTNDRVYVSNNNASGTVTVINPATNTIAATVAVGAAPYGIAYSPTNDRVYVANYSGNTVSVINPATNTVAATISVGTQPTGVAYSPANDRIYVANAVSGTVTVINPATNTIAATATVGTTPWGVAYSPTNDRMYVANAGAGSVFLLSTRI